jgi:GNAT superfamily N-acetyltransferase
MELEILDRRRDDEADARAIAELLCLVWPKAESDVPTRAAAFRAKWKNYHGPPNTFPRSFVLRAGDRIVGHAELGPRTIGTANGELTIGALASVCVHPELRRQQLGRQLVRAAFQVVDDGDYPFALFQNYAERRAFYESLGARVIDNPIVNSLAEDPRANPFWADLAMIYPAAKEWPAGEIDLRGTGY